MYRVKAILADGRKVYHSKRGKIETYTYDQAMEVKHKVPSGAYTRDLFVYEGGYGSVFPKVITVPVVSYEIEHIYQPIDQEAFILGGLRPTEIQN